MRTSIVLPLAALLTLAIAAPVAAGPNVTNQSGGGTTVQGDWWDETSSGSIYLFDETGDYAYGELFEQSGDWVLCDAGDPADEYDDVYGFQGTSTWGYVYDLTITIAGRFAGATATGTAELYVETIDECTGEYDGSSTTESIRVDLTGTGSVAMFRGQGSFKIPGEYNAHETYRGKERQASGSVDLGSLGSRTLDWAIFAEYSWTGHVNA